MRRGMLAVHELRIEVASATRPALHLRPPVPEGRVFVLHGNAGHLRSWFNSADFCRRQGKRSGRIESEA